MNAAARARHTAARQLVEAAAAGGERLTLVEALAAVDAVAAEQPPAPRWRIETSAGLTWSTYASATTPTEVARLAAQARRAGHRARIVNRAGAAVHLTHDASGDAHLVTIPD